MQTYKIITDAAAIASTDPLNFTGAVIGRLYEHGALSRTRGIVVELMEHGYHATECTSFRRSGRNTEPCMWSDGIINEVAVLALISGPIGEEIDRWISHARELLRNAD